MQASAKTALWIAILVLITASFCLSAEKMAVKAEKANVRSGPGLQHERLWQIEKYHPLLILEKKGQWFRFRDFEGDQGWINASLLDKTRCVVVQANRCNVRTGPGTEYDVAFMAGKGIPFKVLQTKGKWTQIQHADGDKGWIYNSLIW